MILQDLNHGHTTRPYPELSHLDWQHAWNVLNLGCGVGIHIARMMELCPQGLIYGIDAAEENVAFAREYNAKGLDKRCFISQGMVDNLPFDVDTFDAVIAYKSLLFPANRKKAFTEAYRVLKPDGYFLLCCDTDITSNSFGDNRPKEMKETHEVNEIKDLLDETGFVDIRIYNSEETYICITAREGNSDNL